MTTITSDAVQTLAEQTAELLADVHALVKQYTVLSDEQLMVVSLWILHTHAFEAADAADHRNSPLSITAGSRDPRNSWAS